MLAVIQAQQKQKEEAERLQREAEERAREEEEAVERRRLEEERRKQEIKDKKKEKEKAKRDRLKKEGKLLTPAQKEREAKNRAARELLLAQGAVPGALEEHAEGEDKKPKKVVYTKKKSGKGKPVDTLAESEPLRPRTQSDSAGQGKVDAPNRSNEKEAKDEEEAEEESEEEESDEDEDDDDEEEEEGQKKEVLDSWEALDSEEEAGGAEEPSESKTEAKPAHDKEAEGECKAKDKETEGESKAKEKEVKEKLSKDAEDRERGKETAVRRAARHDAAVAEATKSNLRSPICCILGHVDTGKTKLLDKIRRTNVQEGEAGGITQQIGATYFPMDRIEEQTLKVEGAKSPDIKVPGLLIIDTPGHESFTNLRVRGSSLCDIAILVVDIMHGLEPQTLESLGLLKARKTPFIVALNKVDRLFGWKPQQMTPIRDALKIQNKDVAREFLDRVADTIRLFAEQGLNAELYYKNKDLRRNISLVPTSAISGEGIPDMLLLLTQLTQQYMSDKLMYLSSLQCTVLEVKVVDGLGTTIDVIIANGVLNEGDTIILNGIEGAIVTSIRALLTPEPMKELRVKSPYVHHKSLQAAIGCKISANGLEKAVAGSQLLVANEGDDIEELKREVEGDFEDINKKFIKKGVNGVYVQASTLGSLEALLEFLNSSQIPVSGISIGPVHRKDVVKASVMLEKDKRYAVILAFDVEVSKDAKELAESMEVRIFTADIIYHLFDQFTKYLSDLKEQKRQEALTKVVFPCVLKIVPQCVFNKKDPIIIGVDVREGILKLGTPICVKRVGFKTGDTLIELGRVTGIERDKKPIEEARKGATVAVKLQGKGTSTYSYERHWDENDEYISKISRESIDVLKEHFRNDLSKDDWNLVRQLKKVYDIP
eukprot:c13143_g1_i1.p1 GENE.c13143_g1_i1~~c13143_g1_i1.p1  ORF type:complete len:883 (+),score=286.54 c13143_g1_i1:418-3066(+)